MRLQQYLARAGVTSRRKAEELIRAGRISVNDQVADIGAAVGETDIVRMDGERIRLPQKVIVIALHKPKGFTTTHEDHHADRLVYDLVPEYPGLHSVGRLDKDTEGLLLLTNDGNLTQFLSHPSNQIPKLYRAWTKRGKVSYPDCARLQEGVLLSDGLAKAVQASPAKDGVKLVLAEGRKREVRRMLGKLGYPVERLVRLAVGPIELGDMAAGEWRYLVPEEVELLRKPFVVKAKTPKPRAKPGPVSKAKPAGSANDLVNAAKPEGAKQSGKTIRKPARKILPKTLLEDSQAKKRPKTDRSQADLPAPKPRPRKTRKTAFKP
jgi:23S rRNA pseudouridine2605 synthase